MNILLINEVCGHTSTGKICYELALKFDKEGHNVKIAYGRDNSVPQCARNYAIRIGNGISVLFHAVLTRLFDKCGFGSYFVTKRFLRWADSFDPDMLWLHNLHGYYINVELLFRWIKKHPNIEVRWTLHDCWSFTGHCAFFSMCECKKWMSHCKDCPLKKAYPGSLFFDNSFYNFSRKKEAFLGVNNMKLITPSNWLKEQVKNSFLKDYPVEVIRNEINKDIFQPTESDFKEKNGLSGKYIVLGVANVWEKRKGLETFINLASIVNKKFVIVLVGINEKQKKSLPANIFAIDKTNNQKELAQIYSAADVFVNPSMEDNYPTVNLEAQACGTPCVVFDACGSPETTVKENVIKTGDIYGLWNRICEIVNGVELQ